MKSSTWWHSSRNWRRKDVWYISKIQLMLNIIWKNLFLLWYWWLWVPFVRSPFFPLTPNQQKYRTFFFLTFIASVAPVTVEEHMLYTTFSTILEIPYYSKPLPRKGRLAFPLKPLFLETIVRIDISCPKWYYDAYHSKKSTPRITQLLQMAASHGWFTIDGNKVKKKKTKAT